MSESRPSKVFMFDNDDPEMQAAYEKARATFRYFWRELAWERRRIIPGLDLACVKAPFSDGEGVPRIKGSPEVEHMWLDQVDFDGQFVSGVVLNAPNWLKTVKAGDPARIPLEEINDWMYVMFGEVYGAHTVNLMRSRMASRALQDHDAAWGLKFGDPHKIRLMPEPKKSGGLLTRWFGGRGDAVIGEQEHPMSENMAPKLKEQLAHAPSMLDGKDDRGWTLLHHQALAGSLSTVSVLLDAGADANAVTDHGMTPLQLAWSLSWEKVIALLESHGAK